MPLALLIAANLLFAGQGVAVKWLNGSLNPLAIALLPFYTAILLGGGLLLRSTDPRSRWHLAWRARNDFLLLGVAGQFLAQAGMTVGVTWSLASNGAILSMLIPVASALLARPFSLSMGFPKRAFRGVFFGENAHGGRGVALHPQGKCSRGCYGLCTCLESLLEFVFSSAWKDGQGSEGVPVGRDG